MFTPEIPDSFRMWLLTGMPVLGYLAAEDKSQGIKPSRRRRAKARNLD